MVDSHLNISVIILSVIGLNIPIKRLRLTGKVLKLKTQLHVSTRVSHILKVYGVETDTFAHTNQKRSGVTTVVSDMKQCSSRKIIKNIET